MTAYALTSGEYSSYTLHAVFTTKERAEQFAEKRIGPKWRDEYCIEEARLDPDPFPLGEDVDRWYVRMDCDGIVEDCHINNAFEPDEPDSIGKEMSWFPFKPGQSFEFWIIAKSREQAIKAANEKRAQKIAMDSLPRVVADKIYIQSNDPIRTEIPGPFRVVKMDLNSKTSELGGLSLYRKTPHGTTTTYESSFRRDLQIDWTPLCPIIREDQSLIVTTTIGAELTIGIEKEVNP